MAAEIQLSIVEDKNAPGDGYVILRLEGVVQQPDGAIALTFEQMSGEPRFLSLGGWQVEPVALAVESVVHRGEVLDIFIGPELTQHLLPGSAILLSIDTLGFAQQLTWPNLTDEPLELESHPDQGLTAGLSDPSPALRAPESLRAKHDASLRAAPRDTPGGRREPKLGRPERPRSLTATTPSPGPQAGVNGRRTPPAPAARRSVPTAPSLSARSPVSSSGESGTSETAMPWEWADQQSASVGETPEPTTSAPDGDEDVPRRSRMRRTGGRRIPLPWRIFSINVILLLVLGAVGYAMVFNGWDPVRMLTGSGSEQVAADRTGPSIQTLPRETAADANAAARQRALDALAVAITGPVGEARSAIEDDVDSQQIYDLAVTFQSEGDPATALSLLEYAAIQGNGVAERAIGRMADPVHFGSIATAFTRPNAELAIDRYRRGLALGDAEASADLDALQAWLQQAVNNGDQEAQNALLLFDATEL